MNNIIDDLFHSNINPSERFYPQTPEYLKAAKLRDMHYEKLEKALNEEEMEAFDKYCDAQGEIEGIGRYDIFSYALKVGILLMAEIFMGGEWISRE